MNFDRHFNAGAWECRADFRAGIGVDFAVGYSPERINPGDKVHTVDKIVKVVSGWDAQTLETVAKIEGSGVYYSLKRSSGAAWV